jgi:hypothetical protein
LSLDHIAFSQLYFDGSNKLFVCKEGKKILGAQEYELIVVLARNNKKKRE